MLVPFSKYFELKGNIIFECLCAECFQPVAMMSGKQLQHRLVRQGRMLCPECAANACFRCRAVVEPERRHYVSDTVFICPVCDIEKGAEWLADWKNGLYTSFLDPAVDTGLSITPYLKKLTRDVTAYVDEIKAEKAKTASENRVQKIPREVE